MRNMYNPKLYKHIMQQLLDHFAFQQLFQINITVHDTNVFQIAHLPMKEVILSNI